MDHPNSNPKMGPSTLDLFILTFNCAKNLINVPVFATHLQQALLQNATGLPDLVVLSLQEIAPLSYSFIGSYFLAPYLSRFEEALNLAAVHIHSSRDSRPSPHDAVSAPPDTTMPLTQSLLRTKTALWTKPPGPYHLIRSANVGMTAILLFARDPSAVHNIQVAECGFGVADMGNKGAVGLRVQYGSADAELTFVATHLAPMEWNLDRRNANWRSIVSGLTFSNPKALVPHLAGAGHPGRKADSAASEARTPEEHAADEWLLSEAQAEELGRHHDTLRDVSIFRPASHLFVAGDLNYRIGARTPAALASFPSWEDGAEHWSHFLERDQLTRERTAERTLHGMSEAAIKFPPTYKYSVSKHGGGEGDEDELKVSWKYASHRWPSWCDRVLYMELPGWVRRRLGERAGEIEVKAYDSLPVVRTSDHQGVFFRAEVPLLSPGEMAVPEEGEVDGDDPRVKLPVAIDVDAWERRAKARRRELTVGWSMFLWSTREGALLIGTLLFVGVGGWWLYQGFT